MKLADGKERTIQHMVATSFWSPDGKPMSAAEFIERLYGDLPELFKDEQELRRSGGGPTRGRRSWRGWPRKGTGRRR
jgi:type I restriction enzyme, R subunit